ncbi:MAG: hypothetical protein JRJ87_01785 [Deltaproteobacteria bacterium]|nr:hypothetical protein [Deltaproteobacteria bacterium]
MRRIVSRALVFVFVAAAQSCVVDDSFLDGKPCDAENQCAGGYICVVEACPDNPGYLCPLCRTHASPDGSTDGGDSDGGPGDSADRGSDQPVSCNQTPPACKTIPECQETQPECISGVWVCQTGFEVVERSCDGVDNDCDGETDRGLVCILAGASTPDLVDGSASDARFNRPYGLATHPSGGIVVADRGNHSIRLVLADGSVSTLAGTGSYGNAEGPADQASFNDPIAVAIGLDNSILIADRLNHRIRQLSLDDQVSTYAGSGFADYLDGPVDTAKFALPSGLAVASDGSIFVADTGNHCIRKISAGQVTTFSGKCEFPGTEDGQATLARYNSPTNILLLSDDYLIVTEESSHKLRHVSIDGSVATLAGTGTAGFKDGQPLEAQFWKPAGCVWDSQETVILIADSGNQRIRAFSIGTAVTTRLGSGNLGLDSGLPLEATFNNPNSLAIFPDGRLVIADTQNHVLRVLMP